MFRQRSSVDSEELMLLQFAVLLLRSTCTGFNWAASHLAIMAASRIHQHESFQAADEVEKAKDLLKLGRRERVRSSLFMQGSGVHRGNLVHPQRPLHQLPPRSIVACRSTYAFVVLESHTKAINGSRALLQGRAVAEQQGKSHSFAGVCRNTIAFKATRLGIVCSYA